MLLMLWCASRIGVSLATIWDAGCGGEMGGGSGFENDTEVAAKVACFFVAVSLKRNCSRFSVAIETSQGQFSTASDVHCRDLIVKGWVGLALRALCVAWAVLEDLDGRGSLAVVVCDGSARFNKRSLIGRSRGCRALFLFRRSGVSRIIRRARYSE
jgi:hypothetical protein